jgi:uncharacterized protein YdeI (YjbR/CyaY-like superfamily)
MPNELKTIDARTRGKWRRWLEKHHATSPGIWLTFYKKHTRVRAIPYDDAVEEALCFGWIDSIVKRLDEDRYVQNFTPRRPGSKWSDINRKRYSDLEARGLLAQPGIQRPPTDKRDSAPSAIEELPAYIEKAFKANPKAWNFFQQLAPSYRRQYVGWIATAKRPETRDRRIREALVVLTSGKKLGLK